MPKLNRHEQNLADIMSEIIIDIESDCLTETWAIEILSELKKCPKYLVESLAYTVRNRIADKDRERFSTLRREAVQFLLELKTSN